MLVLTRKIGESVVIGDDITITVLRVSGNQTSLGFTAPMSLPIHRHEIKKRIDNKEPRNTIKSKFDSLIGKVGISFNQKNEKGDKDGNAL